MVVIPLFADDQYANASPVRDALDGVLNDDA